MQLPVSVDTISEAIKKIIQLCTLTVESYDFGHVDNGHMHQRGNHSDAVFAD